MARARLSAAATVARWADTALRPGRDGAGPGGGGTLSARTAESAAANWV